MKKAFFSNFFRLRRQLVEISSKTLLLLTFLMIFLYNGGADENFFKKDGATGDFFLVYLKWTWKKWYKVEAEDLRRLINYLFWKKMEKLNSKI